MVESGSCEVEELVSVVAIWESRKGRMVETMSDVDQELELGEAAHAGRMSKRDIGMVL